MFLCFLCAIEDKNNFIDEPVRTNRRIPVHVFLRTEVYILVDDNPKLPWGPCILDLPREEDALTLNDISKRKKRIFVFVSTAIMYGKHFLVCVQVLYVASLQGKVVQENMLQLSQMTKCAYDYEVTVYTARGTKSTLSDGYQVHALVRYSSVTLHTTSSYKCKFRVCDVELVIIIVKTIVHVFRRNFQKNVG